MRKAIAIMTLVLAVAAGAWAQGTAFASASSQRYTVWSDAGQDVATTLAARLEGLFAVYNEYFRFDETLLKAPLTVRSFTDKANFDAYLTKVIGQAKDDFVYLHYPTAERSELVIFSKSDAAEYSASLAHQAFVQFLKAFIHEPPLWLREGFAVYFEKTGLNPASKVVEYTENTAWLETVKLLKTQGVMYPMDQIMVTSTDDAKTGLDVFYPQSWALVSFFVNSSERRYNRFIWDAIALLKQDATLEQNQSAVRDFFLRWHSGAAAESDFTAYLAGQKTFAELVTTGVKAYGDRDLDTASKLFAQALAKNSSSYIPQYYLGLIAYARNDYALADTYYQSALTLGADAPITNYALGINAFASRRFDEAKNYLQKAKDGDPTRYTEKVDEILKRIDTGA
ncbi:MAG: hypothetical protein E4H20_09125 [Spirochaetales bacterium]|nr:MAG: hypothetical protein E4H20_09125 [Spirochaetales bacterium]